MKKIVTNISQLVTPAAKACAAGDAMNRLEVREHVSLLIENGLIAQILPSGAELPTDAERIDARRQVVLPAFTDPHTHIPFAGTRENEFNLRIQGKSYMEIAASGGGINSTVRATRAASEDELYEQSLQHLQLMVRHGVASLEMKSGYGLDTETELKQLRVVQRLREATPLDIRATFMGAHEIPPEFKGNKRGYIDLLLNEMLPAVKAQGIADYCDIFCEKDVFEIDESREILQKAQELGFKIRLHADEIAPLGGAELAAELRAVSADHLMRISDAGIEQMVAAGTVFTMLPGTTFFLMSDHYAPAQKIIAKGGVLALSTDFNPGSSFTHSLPLIINLACLRMGLSIQQALNAATINAAYAVELADVTGSIHVGKQADLLFLDAPNYEFLVYNFGVNRISGVMKKGEWLTGRFQPAAENPPVRPAAAT